MNRRTLIIGGASVAGLAITGAGLFVATGAGSAHATLDAVRRTLDRLESAGLSTMQVEGSWHAGAVLTHLARSIDYSRTGYPEPRSALFQQTVGAAALSVFTARGAMRHGVDSPIPGAPPLPEVTAEQGMQTLRAALDAFEAHTGSLKPHFAYGALSFEDYVVAHALHVQDHLGPLA